MNEIDAIKKFLKANCVERLDIKAALIDMDGVLYDSMKNHTAAWFRMATELGIKSERDEFYLYEGMTGAATIDILFRRAYNRNATPDEAHALYEKKAEYFNELGEPVMMPDADRMLGVLRDNGIQRILVTGSGQKSILERLDRDYPGMFVEGKRVTAHNVTHGKPNPEPYLKGQQFAGCSPAECIVIENAPLGVQAGHASGSFTIGITTGPIPDNEMWKSGADLVYGSMAEFADALPRLIELAKSTTL